MLARLSSTWRARDWDLGGRSLVGSKGWPQALVSPLHGLPALHQSPLACGTKQETHSLGLPAWAVCAPHSALSHLVVGQMR